MEVILREDRESLGRRGESAGRCALAANRYGPGMLQHALMAYAARIRSMRLAHADVSEPALAPEFQRLLNDCLPLIPAAPQLTVVPEFQNPGIGRPDIALRPAVPARLRRREPVLPHEDQNE